MPTVLVFFSLLPRSGASAASLQQPGSTYLHSGWLSQGPALVGLMVWGHGPHPLHSSCHAPRHAVLHFRALSAQGQVGRLTAACLCTWWLGWVDEWWQRQLCCPSGPCDPLYLLGSPLYIHMLLVTDERQQHNCQWECKVAVSRAGWRLPNESSGSVSSPPSWEVPGVGCIHCTLLGCHCQEPLLSSGFCNLLER